MKQPKHLQKITIIKNKLARFRFLKRNLLIFILAFMIIGTVSLILIYATTPSTSIEPENGTVTSPATVGSDNNASGGKYTQLGCSTTPPANAFNVVTPYGADPNGHQDSTDAIRSAIAAASAAGGRQTVYFPLGTYLLDKNDGQGTDFKLDNVTVNILGAGRDGTKIVEKVGVNNPAYPALTRGKNVFSFANMSGFCFTGLTVDSQTWNAGDTIDNFGDNSTIDHSQFLGAENNIAPNNKNDNVFDMRVIAVCNQDPNHTGYGVFHSGNTINDVKLNGRGHGGNDDLDFSCERNGTISNIDDTGWGTALYIDQNVTITNYNFTPGTYDTSPPGFFITVGDHMTINNFTTSGRGGIIKNPNFRTTNTTINNEKVIGSGFNLDIGDADNTTITNSTLTGINISPAVSTNGITVTGSTTGFITCKPGAIITALSGITCGQ